MKSINYNNQTINYEIIRKKIKNVYIGIEEQKVIVKVPRLMPEEQIENLVNQKSKWIYERLNKGYNKIKRTPLYSQEEFVNIIKNNMQNLIQETGLHPNKVRIKDIKYAWGTCSSGKNITLNFNLIKYEKHVIRYVILHELCHIKYMNHSEKFWRMVENHMPDYKQAKKILKSS